MRRCCHDLLTPASSEKFWKPCVNSAPLSSGAATPWRGHELMFFNHLQPHKLNYFKTFQTITNATLSFLSIRFPPQCFYLFMSLLNIVLFMTNQILYTAFLTEGKPCLLCVKAQDQFKVIKSVRYMLADLSCCFCCPNKKQKKQQKKCS